MDYEYSLKTATLHMQCVHITLTLSAVVRLSTRAPELCCQHRGEPPETPREQTTASPPAPLMSGDSTR